jgi:regulatory protein
VTGWQSSRRRGPDGRRGARRQDETAGGDPLNPDVVPGPPEDDPGDPVSAARGICLRALTGAPKTRSQLADLLAARDIPDDAAEAVLDRFTEVGLIDDAAFARAWVSSRQAGRGLARRALSAELRAKGVDAEVAAEAVEAVDEDDERAAAQRLVARRVPGMRRLDRATATRRLVGMLARKGYNGGLAAAVVREALDDDGVGDPHDDDLEALDEDVLLP